MEHIFYFNTLAFSVYIDNSDEYLALFKDISKLNKLEKLFLTIYLKDSSCFQQITPKRRFYNILSTELLFDKKTNSTFFSSLKLLSIDFYILNKIEIEKK